MSLGQKIIDAIERRRDRQRRNQPGAVGQFWRDGGNQLLYDLPVTTGGLIIDAGGYQGEWSAGMISRYGCRSKVFEPVPAFFEHCQTYLKIIPWFRFTRPPLVGQIEKQHLIYLIMVLLNIRAIIILSILKLTLLMLQGFLPRWTRPSRALS